MTSPKNPRSWQESQPMIVSRSLSASKIDDLPIMTQFSVGTGTPVIDNAIENVADEGPIVQQKKTTHSSRRRRRTSSMVSAMSEVSAGTVFQTGVRLIDRYEVLRKIGQGGMSSVYEAYDEARDENVAVKVLLPELACNPRLQERFLQEGRLSSSFSHPNIARVYDLHQTETVVMISMELLHGCNLRQDMERRINQRQKYRPTEVLHVINEVSDALTVVHAQSVIHRDLKPENLWAGLDESIKIMDFGIAREAVGAVFTTGRRGSGTPYYIAPEQLAASPTLDHRADQYSLAVLAYEMLTGVIPQGAIVPPHVKQPGIPKKLSKAIFKALSSDPNKRFPNIQAFADAARFRVGMSPWMRAAMIFGGTIAIGGAAAGYQLKIAPMLESKPSTVWGEIAPAKIVEKSDFSLICRALDSTLPNDKLTFKLLADAPEGAVIDSATGKISWKPTEAQGPKDYQFQVMAVVQQEGESQKLEERTVNVSVTEAMDAPVFEVPEVADAKEHVPFELALKAQDTNMPVVALRYELTSGPLDMEIDSKSGKITWKPDEKDGGSVIDVAVKVALEPEVNRSVAIERKFKIRIAETIDPPTFISSQQLKAEVGEPVDFKVVARDSNDPPLNVYYKLRNGDRAGVTIDPNSGELNWTPEKEQSAKEFDLIVEAYYDDNGQGKRIGEQTIKMAVEKFEEPKKPESPTKPVATTNTTDVTSGNPFGQSESLPTPATTPQTCPTKPQSPQPQPAPQPAPQPQPVPQPKPQAPTPAPTCPNSSSASNQNNSNGSGNHPSPNGNPNQPNNAIPTIPFQNGQVFTLPLVLEGIQKQSGQKTNGMQQVRPSNQNQSNQQKTGQSNSQSNNQNNRKLSDKRQGIDNFANQLLRELNKH